MEKGDAGAKKGDMKNSNTVVEKDETTVTQKEKVDGKSKNTTKGNDEIINEGESDMQDEFGYLNETAVHWLDRYWNVNTFYNISRLFTTLRYRGFTRPYKINASTSPMASVAYDI